MTDLKRLLGTLVESNVKFIIIGGAAAVAHGSARLTQDIDIVYERSAENIEMLVKALKNHHPYLRGCPPGLPFRLDEETVTRGLNFTLTTDLGDIDLFGEITGGGDYGKLEKSTIVLTVFGLKCLCLDLEKLIEVKRAAGRPKDLEIISELETLREEQQL